MEKYKLYENPIFDNITGTSIRPGGFKITEQAIKFCNFPKKASLLDIGCGCGASIEYIEKNFNYHCSGIDLSSILVDKGLKRNPNLDLSVGNCEELPSISFTIDGVLAECSFSLMKNKEAVLDEVKRVLQPKGKLIISDMYIRNKNVKEFLNESSIETCILNAFLVDEFKLMLENKGFKIILFEDHTNYLKELIATIIMEYGSAKYFWEMVTNKSVDCEAISCMVRGLKLGYFLCIAEVQK